MVKYRRLEYFEDQLDETALGREVLSVIEKHADEVMGLINHNRPVIVAWNRNKGPAFIKSFMDSGYEEDQPFVREVDGVSMQRLLLAMSEQFMDYGSIELKASIGKYAHMVFKIAAKANSLAEIMKMIRENTFDQMRI